MRRPLEHHHDAQVRRPRLEVDRRSIPADGATPAVVTYRNWQTSAPTEVTFDANGIATTVALDQGWAELEVVTTVAGPVVVTVDVLPGEEVTIQAEAV